MILDMIFLQAAGPSSMLPNLLLIAMVLIFWFFFIRPQTNKAKEEQKFISEGLDKGMEVVTKSGLIGKINKIDSKEIQLQVDTKTFIRITRGAVSKELTDAYHTPADEKK